jgi:predicted ATPase
MLIKRLSLKKILSFTDAEVELRPLNVLIGANAAGKSNFIEAISLLQAAPTNISAAILRGGGVRQWCWLGDKVPSPVATIRCELEVPEQVKYEIEFSESAQGFVILTEKLAQSTPDADWSGIYVARAYQSARVMRLADLVRTYQEMGLSQTDSFLSQFRNPFDTTPITRVVNSFSQMRIYREFRTGLQSAARYGISTNASKDSLSDGGENLALVLLDLDVLGVHDQIREYLRRFCERFEDVKVSVGEGLARTLLREAGLSEMLSAIRMSDGTLKFLSLLVALFHPRRPMLMCIEEPETGLHPDAMQLVAEALIEASEYMQLIVTTHSEALVDALSDNPESVLVCERDFDNGTQMRRLERDRLKGWLERYRLGELWRKGEIGGNRW